MVSAIIKVWNKRINIGNSIHCPVPKTYARVVNIVHVNCKVGFNSIKYKLNRPINRVVWSTEDNPMPSSKNHIHNLNIVMGT